MNTECKCGQRLIYHALVHQFICNKCQKSYPLNEMVLAIKKYNKYQDKYFKNIFSSNTPFLPKEKKLIDFIGAC